MPVYADETAPDGAVRVSANVAQNLGIRLGKAEMAQLHPHLNAVEVSHSMRSGSSSCKPACRDISIACT